MKISALTAGLLLGCFVLPCAADVIAINLDVASVVTTPPSVVTFSGSLTNLLDSTVFLNSAGLNLSGNFLPSDLDVGPFFINAPFFLVPAEATASLDLFVISVPQTLAPGSYIGTFAVLGGSDENAQDVLGTAACNSSGGLLLGGQ